MFGILSTDEHLASCGETNEEVGSIANVCSHVFYSVSIGVYLLLSSTTDP